MSGTVRGTRMEQETTNERLGRDRGAFLRFAAMAAVSWFAASLGASLLHVSARGSAWHDEGLPLAARVSLIGLELFVLTYPAILVTLPVFALLGRPDRSPEGNRWRRPRIALAALIVAAPALAYTASWAVFRSTGHFLSQSTLALWWSSPFQMAEHMAHFEPATPFVVIFGALGFGAAVVFAMSRLSGRLKGRLGWSVVGVALVLIPGSLFLPRIIGWQAVDGFMRARRADGTGPLLSVVAEVMSREAANSEPLFRAVRPVVSRNPLVSMEDYLSGSGTSVADSLNLLIVVIESLRTDQLTSFGGARSAMPTVDSLARQGLRFTRHYTQASHSDYADPTILSSHFPLRSSSYHVYPEAPPYPRVLIYDVLKSLGYRVGIFSSQNEAWGGMKHYLDTGSIDRFLHAETYDGETYVPERDDGFSGWAARGRKSGKIDDRFTVSEAVKWIGEGEAPFVVYMNLQNSHVPYVVPADFDAPFGSGRVSFPILFGAFPPDSVDAVMDLYGSSLAYVDSQISRLVGELERAGRLENTIVVFTADTGQAFYEHGFTSHGSALYDEVMHVPLVVVGPGISPAERRDPTQHVDITPTLLGLLGLDPHPAFQGVDLLSPGAETAERNVFILGQALEEQYGIVRGDWKLIFDAKRLTYELYDLLEDPAESVNLADTRPGVTRELAELVHAWRKAQLEYYGSAANFSSHYPPVVTGAVLSGEPGEGAGPAQPPGDPGKGSR